jgi:hypothetical protein
VLDIAQQQQQQQQQQDDDGDDDYDDDYDDEGVERTQYFTNEEDSNSDNSRRIKPDYNGQNEGGTSFTTMTPHQIAKWIDKRSRVLFPVSFLVFNIIYWGFIFLDMAQKKSTEET